MRKKIIFLPFLLGLTACSFLQMHHSRNAHMTTYDTPLDLEKEKRTIEFQEVSKELGLSNTANLSEFQMLSIQNRVRLKRLEKQLRTSVEKRQYFQYKPLLKSDAQRIHFLSLGTLNERENYALSKGIDPLSDQITAKDRAAINESDLYIGMSKLGVRSSWGEPKQIEIAGAPIYGNERWAYEDYVPSPDGYVLEKKIIYFEGSRVVGWEKR